jgi:hypothetical protein
MKPTKQQENSYRLYEKTPHFDQQRKSFALAAQSKPAETSPFLQMP